MSGKQGGSKMDVRGKIVRDNQFGLYVVKQKGADRHFAVTTDKWEDASFLSTDQAEGKDVIVTVTNGKVIGARSAK